MFDLEKALELIRKEINTVYDQDDNLENELTEQGLNSMEIAHYRDGVITGLEKAIYAIKYMGDK